MTFDMSINLGHIITVISVLITFITWGQSVKWNLINLDKRVEIIEKDLQEQTKLLIANAVMNTNLMTMAERLGTLEKRLDAVQYERSKNRVT
jgi:hypothetical protein